MKTKICEIFPSIQGEGTVVGYKQLFIRFCGCNLKCNYCDTEFSDGVLYSSEDLCEKIIGEYDLRTFHSVSLTGGEPLLSAEFLLEFLPKIKDCTKIYLETNATLGKKFKLVRNYVDIVSADIKLPSSTGGDTFELHDDFFKYTKGIETFAKIVFDKNITQDEIEKCIQIAKKYDIELILQPMMIGDKMSVSSDFCNDILDKFTQKYHKVRLIPQVHKFLDVR